MYPALHTHMLQSLIEKLGESEKSVSPAIKRQIGKFLQTPLDPLHTPFSTMMSQQMYAQQQAEQQEMGSVAKGESSTEEIASIGNRKTRSQTIGELA